MSEPTSIDFRIGETQGILDDLAALHSRIASHIGYLTDPVLVATHMQDVRDHDVVLANLSLASAATVDATRQTAIALRMTKLAADAKAKAALEPPPEEPAP